jgi:hypothetical protein
MSPHSLSLGVDTNALCEIYLRLLFIIRTQIKCSFPVFAISHHPMDDAEDLVAMAFSEFSKGGSSSTL